MKKIQLRLIRNKFHTDWFTTLQWRLLVVVLMLAASYTLGIIYLRHWHTVKVSESLQKRVHQDRDMFARLLELKGHSLYTFSYDYTYWDEMVTFVQQDVDSNWAEENLAESMGTYETNAIWIYDSSFSQHYFQTNLEGDDYQHLNVLPNSYQLAFVHSRFAHYFTALDGGILEIRGATIHPSSDAERTSNPAGYLFVGRLWDRAYLDKLGRLIGGHVELSNSITNPPVMAENYDSRGIVSWSHHLSNWDNQPVATLSVQVFSAEIQQQVRTTNFVHILSALLTLGLLAVVAWVLARWVAIPLRRISSSLDTEATAPIQYLFDETNELGHIARLIRRFLQQKGELVHEIEHRKRAEQEREILEAQLRRAQRLETIGTLAGGVAHDFNNILTPILGYSDMLMTRMETNNPMRSDIQHIAKAALRARDLVRQILAFSRQSEQERLPVQLHLIISEALDLIHASMPTTIEIHEELNPLSGSVMCDPSQMHQVLVNLCTNAVQAMEENGGVLEIRLSEMEVDAEFSCLHLNINEGHYARLTVTDTGCGMDRATVERIFEPFFTTKSAGKGTGLGLSVVHGIVLSHGGSITVYSEPGRGTTFHVYLPCIPDTKLRPTLTVEETPRGSERILLVDDEKEIAVMGKDMLERLGYNVTMCTKSADALEMFRADPLRFDAVVTDQTMPQMTGDRLAKEMLNLRSDIPIVMITGFSERITEETYRRHGIREFVMKPLIARDLSKAIRKAVTATAMAETA